MRGKVLQTTQYFKEKPAGRKINWKQNQQKENNNVELLNGAEDQYDESEEGEQNTQQMLEETEENLPTLTKIDQIIMKSKKPKTLNRI